MRADNAGNQLPQVQSAQDELAALIHPAQSLNCPGDGSARASATRAQERMTKLRALFNPSAVIGTSVACSNLPKWIGTKGNANRR